MLPHALPMFWLVSVRIRPFVTYFGSRFMVSRGTWTAFCNFHTCFKFSYVFAILTFGCTVPTWTFAILIRVSRSHTCFQFSCFHNWESSQFCSIHRNQYQCKGVRGRVITTCKLFDIFAQSVLESNNYGAVIEYNKGNSQILRQIHVLSARFKWCSFW